MVQMKRVSTRELILALSGAILVLATLGAGSALAQGATPAVPAPTTAPTPAGAPGAPAIPAGVVPPPGYVIGPEDALSVVFWREKDMSTDAAVRPDGMITVPLLNDIHAAGLTPDQLRERIQTAAAKFVEDPTVTVVVKAINSRKVFITGLVAKPGQYPLAGPTSVMQLIAMAGGLQEYADSKKILIMRTEGGEQVAKPFNYQDVLNRKEPEAEHRPAAWRHGHHSVATRMKPFLVSMFVVSALLCGRRGGGAVAAGAAVPRTVRRSVLAKPRQLLTATGSLGTGWSDNLARRSWNWRESSRPARPANSSRVLCRLCRACCPIRSTSRPSGSAHRWARTGDTTPAGTSQFVRRDYANVGTSVVLGAGFSAHGAASYQPYSL